VVLPVFEYQTFYTVKSISAEMKFQMLNTGISWHSQGGL